jgi:drug/metabolite transporter (DMT)-like permease/integral membrane sensor domain MASE1
MTPRAGWLPWGLRVLLLAAAFAAADALASLTTGAGSGVAGVWLPGGVALAGLLLGGPGLWPALVIGGLAAAPAYGPVGAATAPVVLANALAAIVAAWAIRRLGADPRLGRLGDVTRFALGALAGAVPFGALGIASLFAFGSTEEGGTAAVVALWVLSTVTGFIVVGGAVTVLVLRARDRVAPSRLVEVGALLVATALLAWMFFSLGHGVALLPLILVTALLAGRGGPRGAALAMLVIFGFAAEVVVSGGGPFGGGDLIGRSLTYQTAVVAIGVGLQAIGAIGSGEPGAAPEVPSRSLALALLAGGGLALGISEAVVTPEVILLAEKAQVTLLSMCVALVAVLGVLAGTGARGHLAALRSAGSRWWAMAVLAGIAIFGAEELFLLSLASLEVPQGVVLSSLAPVLLLAAWVVRGRVRPTPTLVMAVIAALVGFYCLTPGDTWLGGVGAGGVWFALASSACSAIALTALAACRPRTSAGPVIGVAFASAAVSALVLCLALGIVPGSIVFEEEQVVGGALYIGVVGALIPVVVATWALPILGATRVALFEVLAPPMAILAALAWGEAAFDAWQGLGVILVVAGLAAGVRAHRGAHAPG